MATHKVEKRATIARLREFIQQPNMKEQATITSDVAILPNKGVGASVTKQIKGKLAHSQIVNTDGWNVAKWYSYIMDDTNYNIVVDVQVINDTVRKIIRDSKPLSIEDIRSIYYATLSNTSKSASPDDVIAVIMNVIEKSVALEARLSQLHSTRAIRLINDIKTGQNRTNPSFFDLSAKFTTDVAQSKDYLTKDVGDLNLTKMIGNKISSLISPQEELWDGNVANLQPLC